MSETHPGPLPFFDYHLKVLEESFIHFFQERVRIEEAYVDSLRRLHLKHRALDTYRDDRSDRMTSVRKAWREVGDNAERETETREAFLDILKSEVLGPLNTLRDTEERTRKRIKEDLKNATGAHVDYLENTLPRLKRNYLKKCQETEDLKPDKYYISTAFAPIGSEHDHPLSKVTSTPIGSPMPMRPPVRQPSVNQPSSGRTRSPSSSTAFSDLAHQGKKQLNSLMTFLNESGKGGVAKEGSGGRAETALRSVRARREADEADKEYRKGVHWLETLRLRRVKTLENGYESLGSFISELADLMKKVLAAYVSGLVATSSTITQLSNHLEPIINSILPSEDTFTYTAMFPRAKARDIPKPVLYYNYTVGECRDLIFGVALVDYATAHNLLENAVPRVVELCVREVEARGMDTEGIYRVSGRYANVQELKSKIERDERNFHFSPGVDDVSCVASLLKLYLRELPEPVFRFPLTERVQHSDEREGQISNNFPVLRSKLRRLPPVHQVTLRCILEHLARVSSRSQYNKMDAKNLAIVFGGVIFGEDELPKAGDILTMQSWKDTVMEDLIAHTALLFDDRQAPTLTEPPLPLPPSGEPTPRYDYGSSYTRSHTLPPRSQDGQDFTPALPPRPEQSIHPSRRANLQTPVPDSFEESTSTLPLQSAETSSFLTPSHEPNTSADPSSTSSVTVVQNQENVMPEVEQQLNEVNYSERTQLSNAGQQSPQTPDTFTTAMSSSPMDGSETGKKSRPTSRPSTAHSQSPTTGTATPHLGGEIPVS